MTTDPVNNLAALARRAADCRHFRWTDGMLPLRWAPGFRDHLQRDARAGRARVVQPDAGYVPDLSDPATRGCMLELVREAWEDPRAHARPELGVAYWYVWRWTGGAWQGIGAGRTEAEALVSALEGAP